MRGFTLTAIAMLVRSLPLITATPIAVHNDPMRAARSQAVCANAPNIVAGRYMLALKCSNIYFAPRLQVTNFLSAFSLTPATLEPRDTRLSTLVSRVRGQAIIWCAPNSRTNVAITMAETIAGSEVPDMLVACFTEIMTHIVVFGDSVVSNGVFSWTAGNLAIHVWNANNHQITWGVLGAAVHALEDFMFHTQHWGGASFDIYDGQNMVARGLLGLHRLGSAGGSNP